MYFMVFLILTAQSIGADGEKPSSLSPFDILDEAIFKDDVDTVVTILRNNFAGNVNTHNESGWTALHSAAAYGSRLVIDYLLSNNANVSAETVSTREQPIHAATWRHQVEIVRILLEHSRYADLRQRLIGAVDSTGRTPLCIAAQVGNTQIGRHLFQANDRPQKEVLFEETSCPFGMPQRIGNPLHVSVIYNQANFVEFLLSNGRKKLVKSVDSTKSTALHVAAFREAQIFKPSQKVSNYPTLHDSMPPGPGDNVAGPLVISLFIGAMQDAPGDTIGSALLAKGADLEAVDEDGRTPFLAAASAGVVIYAKFLHNSGANVSAVDNFGYNAFHIASDSKMLAFLMELVVLKQLSHDINVKSNPCPGCSVPGSLTPLQVAIVEKKPVEVVRFLLHHNALVEPENDLGDTAIHLAVKTNNTEALELLLEKANALEILARPDSSGKKPLQTSVELGSVHMTQLLLTAIASTQTDNHGAINDFLEELKSRSPLREAIVRKNYHAFKMVFEKEDGQPYHIDRVEQLHALVARDELSRVRETLTAYFHDDLDLQNETGWTLLHVAALHDAHQIGEFLMRNGANLTLRNENGELPIHLAILANSYRFIDYMLRTLDLTGQGEIVEAEQNEGETPLFYAGRSAKNSSTPRPFAAAEKLMEHLANIEHVNRRGRQAIHEAVIANNREFAEFLVKHGAKLTAKCCQPAGKTAFHLAAEYDSGDIFDGPLFTLLNETVVDNYEFAPICIAANAGSVKFARKMFEFSKVDGSVKEMRQSCVYLPSYNARGTGDPIHIAVSSNQLKFVNFLADVEGGAVLRSMDSAGRSLLHVAAFRENNSEMAMALIEKGVDLEAKEFRGRTPFLFAIERSALKYAEFLQLKGADASAVDSNGYTAFHIANNGETVNYLLQLHLISGIRHTLETKSKRCHEVVPHQSEECLVKGGLTPLHVALVEGKAPNFVRYLLNHDADLSATNDFGQTAFHLAVKSIDSEALNVLLKKLKSTEILAMRDRNGDTALHLAIKENNLSAIKAILFMEVEHNDVTSMLNGAGLTPLHQAITDGNIEVVELLLQHGAKIAEVDAFGRTALRFAVRKGLNNKDLELFQDLLIHAAKESAIDLADHANGDTALHRAVDLELKLLAGLLLDNGASCSVRNRNGLTPLHIAISDGFDDLAKHLLNFPGCNPLDLTDGSGMSIIELDLMRRFAPAFVEATLMAHTANCTVLARKIQLALRMESLHYAEVLLKTMGVQACGSFAAAINHLNADGYSVFHTALISGNIGAVNWCIENGASIGKRTGKGRSAINLALFGQLTERVVEFTANITQTLGNDQTACMAVDYELKKAASTRGDLVKLLIKSDALLIENYIDEDNSNTPLHYLAVLGDVGMGKEIVANGRINVNSNAVNKNGLTALHLCALAGGRDAVDFMELLLEYGGDVSIPSTFKTKEGDSGLLPFHVAASRCGNADTLDSLIYYVLHQFERNSAVTFLLRVSTNKGKTTPFLAAKYHHIDLYLRMVEVFEYFRSWNKQPFKSLLTLPNIRAILPLPSGREAVIVCYNGDILGISTDCESILWRSKVYPPKEFAADFQGIYHAALDSITKHVYFTFHHPMREAGIFYTTLGKLSQQTNNVVLDSLNPNGTNGSQYLALYVDAERETILANDPWVNHNIAAYSLSDGRLLNRSTVHTPASIERFEPLFCSLSRPSPPVANTDSGPRLLAVSDHNHRVHLFKRKPDGRDNLETTFVATIADEDPINPSRLGAVFYPADLTFDHLGNLYVADYLNRRLQIFASADLLDGTSLRAVWTTDKMRSEVQRVALSISGNFKVTALVGLESGHILCFKHSHKKL